MSLKRSISPSTTSHSSREGHLVSIGSAPVSTDETAPMSPSPRPNSGDFNVRGSLTLLKTKAASSRRRRSVADIEAGAGANQVQNGAEREAAGGVTPTSTSTSIDNPPLQNYKPSVGSRPPPQSVPVRSNAHISVDLSSYLPAETKRAPQYEERDRHDEQQFEGAEEEVEQEKFECPTCARSFYRAPLEKHVKICAKVFLQKRKTFDSAKMRIEANPDLKEFIQETKGPAVGRAKKGGKPILERKASGNVAPPAAPSAAIPAWKAQSEAFRSAMQSSRAVSAAIATGAPLPPPVQSAPDPSLVPCPHCHRTFNSGAAERHIPVCTSIRAKPSVLKRGGGGNASRGLATPNGTSGRNNKSGIW